MLTVINCLGVRAGGTVQSGLMVLKIVAIGLLVFAGAFLVRGHITWKPVLDQPVSPGLVSSFGAAMVPVVFAFGGWHTATFASAEMKDPRRDLPRALDHGSNRRSRCFIRQSITFAFARWECEPWPKLPRRPPP